MLKFPIETKAFIRAALIHLRTGINIGPLDEQRDLFSDWGITADDPGIFREYEAIKSREPWGRELESSEVQNLVFFNLRICNPDWHLLTQALGELLDQGPKYLLIGAGNSGKKIIAKRNQVVKEIHRLTGFTRLIPAPDGTMVGKAPTKHQTGDLVALGLARRNPGTPLALITPTGSWYALNGKAVPISPGTYQEVDDEEFSNVWMTYYRSQFIQERNNPRHAARAIPKEYWNWLSEGQELLSHSGSQKSEV